MSQPPNQTDENPVAKAYQSWSATCPFASRSMSLIIAGSWVVGFFFRELHFSFSNCPQFTVNHFEVYRLVTSLLCSDWLITVVFSLLTFNDVGPRLENSLGSTGMISLMVTLTVAANVGYIVVCLALKMLGMEEFWVVEATGFWNLLIALIAVDCMAAPDVPRRLLLFPTEVSAKQYPLILAGMFSLFRFHFLDIWCAVGVGYAYASGKLDRIKTSRATLMSWESGCLSNFISYQGYITTSSAVGAAAWAPLNNPADHPMNQGREGGGSGFSLFRGSGGESGDGGSLRGSANDGFGSNNVIKRGSGSSGSGGSAFGGSGQALGGRIGGGGSTLTGRGPARHDAEAARAARLAALEARGTGGAEGQESALADAEMGRVAARASDMDESLEVLQEMGFSAAEARLALERCDGDVEAAVSQLSAK